MVWDLSVVPGRGRFPDIGEAVRVGDWTPSTTTTSELSHRSLVSTKRVGGSALSELQPLLLLWEPLAVDTHPQEESVWDEGASGAFKRKMLWSRAINWKCQCDVTFLHPRFKIGFMPIWSTSWPSSV